MIVNSKNWIVFVSQRYATVHILLKPYRTVRYMNRSTWMSRTGQCIESNDSMLIGSAGILANDEKFWAKNQPNGQIDLNNHHAISILATFSTTSALITHENEDHYTTFNLTVVVFRGSLLCAISRRGKRKKQ